MPIGNLFPQKNKAFQRRISQFPASVEGVPPSNRGQDARDTVVAFPKGGMVISTQNLTLYANGRYAYNSPTAGV